MSAQAQSPADEPAPHWSPQTLSVTAGRPQDPGAPLNQPPVLASNFRDGGDTLYARFGTPSHDAFEEAIGALEGGLAVAFSSGMAAAAAILGTLPAGARVVTSDNIYHGVRGLLADLERLGSAVDVRVDALDLIAVEQALTDAALLWIETPSNPLIQVLDVERLCRLAEEHGVPVVVDSTFATPMRLNPLALGATYVVHSATKYIGGHSDLLMGVVVARDEERLAPISEQRTLRGAAPGALETFLALRGLRTLGLRLDRAETNAQVLAQRLLEHPHVTEVFYPGLPSDPGHLTASRQMRGFGAMLSFCVASEDEADRVLARCRLIVGATSLGGVESTAERRNRWHEGTRTGLIRLSVGIEDLDDIWADLSPALGQLSPQTQR
ncbi:trans-sulfuration enzyme family protein [Parenemella sanctibonifatiensis]|uniref:Cystathionine gamma-synthase n=1 Tax=Parenemella sanctibonifatiensis TaxID=2016505 RepID=A0A255EP10_9ACTN|nr:PLP-dependent aspartate aminotransferase family protein [Parenemella sanctibonifatiensis]OYN91202.1 cystathionine gamma-synthase [Parenemella sanctibonifatiensis]